VNKVGVFGQLISAAKYKVPRLRRNIAEKTWQYLINLGTLHFSCFLWTNSAVFSK